MLFRSWEGRGADSMVRRLIAQLEARGGRLLRGVRVRSLTMAGERCTGVVGEQDGQPVQFDAEVAVLIADGGFQADRELLGRHVTREPARLLQRNAQTGAGDGLRMAEAIGAELRGLDRFYGHVQSRDAMTNPLLWPYPTMDTPIHFGIAVDGNAKRFCDEGLGGVHVANMIAHAADPLSAWIVCDAKTWTTTGARMHISSPSPLLEREGGTIIKAPTKIGRAHV